MSFPIREEENLVTLFMFNLCQNCRPGYRADLCKELIVHCRKLGKLLTRRLSLEKENKVAEAKLFSPGHFSHLSSCIWKLDAVSREGGGRGLT